MKKILLILTAALLASLVPTVALANGPGAPYPYDADILVKDYTQIREITAYGIADGEEILIRTKSYDEIRRETETKRANERIVDFDFEGYSEIYLQVKTADGEMQKTDVVQVKEYTSYIYSSENNTFEIGVIDSRELSFGNVIGYLVILVVPLLATLLIEWIVAWIFKLKPYTNVLKINAITNPIMNILILIILSKYIIEYWVVVLILEIIVFGVEYLYYIIKYKEHKKYYLAIFALVANACSWGLYSLFTWIS